MKTSFKNSFVKINYYLILGISAFLLLLNPSQTFSNQPTDELISLVTKISKLPKELQTEILVKLLTETKEKMLQKILEKRQNITENDFLNNLEIIKEKSNYIEKLDLNEDGTKITYINNNVVKVFDISDIKNVKKITEFTPEGKITALKFLNKEGLKLVLGVNNNTRGFGNIEIWDVLTKTKIATVTTLLQKDENINMISISKDKKKLAYSKSKTNLITKKHTIGVLDITDLTKIENLKGFDVEDDLKKIIFKNDNETIVTINNKNIRIFSLDENKTYKETKNFREPTDTIKIGDFDFSNKKIIFLTEANFYVVKKIKIWDITTDEILDLPLNVKTTTEHFNISTNAKSNFLTIYGPKGIQILELNLTTQKAEIKNFKNLPYNVLLHAKSRNISLKGNIFSLKLVPYEDNKINLVWLSIPNELFIFEMKSLTKNESDLLDGLESNSNKKYKWFSNELFLIYCLDTLKLKIEDLEKFTLECKEFYKKENKDLPELLNLKQCYDNLAEDKKNLIQSAFTN